MKRILCLLSIFFLMMINTAYAETQASADANLDFNYVSEGSTYYSENVEAPNLIQAHKMDGANVTIPGAYRNTKGGNKKLPQFYQDLGFQICDFYPNKTVNVQEMKELSKFWFFNSAKKTGHTPLEYSESSINLLDYFPRGEDVYFVSYDYTKVKTDLTMPFLPVYTSLHKAWEKGKKPKNAIILYKVTPITEGDIKALGLAGVNSTAHAGSEPGKSVSSGAFGSGWGSAKSWVWDSCYYLVIFFNKSGDNLTASSPKAKKQASKVIKNTREIKTQNVYFDFDSSEIDSEKQIKTIEYNTQILKDILPKLSQNQKIYIVGCTSDEGSNEYNIILGENRAYEVAKAYAENLQKYFNPNFVLDKIKFVSMGELFPQYKKLKNNRRTYIIIAEEL